LIEVLDGTIRSRRPHQRRDCVDNQPKAIFGFLDFVKSFLLLDCDTSEVRD